MASSAGTRLRDLVPPLVECSWVASQTKAVRILDASWYLPTAGRNPREEFSALGHLPDARFFDLDRIPDHMLPTPAEFAAWASELELRNDSHVVLYDTAGSSFSAPRAWWTFRALGHERVSVLAGGMNRWTQLEYPLETGPGQCASSSASPSYDEQPAVPGMVYGYEQVLRLVRDAQERGSSSRTVVDARPAGRFTGADPEPRPGIPSGHMPGSISLPFSELRVADPHGGQYEVLNSAEGLSKVLSKTLGADYRERPWVTSCGSGLTAAVVTFALHLTGAPVPPLYDGSWTEYAQQPSSLIERTCPE